MNSMSKELVYVYCITNKKPDLNFDNSDEIYTNKINELYAVFKYVSYSDYSEENIKNKISDILWLDHNVRNHLNVITAVMNQVQVIPLNFGTIYKSEESVQEFVLEYYEMLNKNIQYIKNKEEWSVYVLCEKKIIKNNIELFSKEIKEISVQAKASSPGKAYILEKKKIQMIEYEVVKIYNEIIQNILSRLKKLSDEWRVNTISENNKEYMERDMILNAVFFLKNELVNRFTECCDEINGTYESYGIILEVKGPWPPYTFIKYK